MENNTATEPNDYSIYATRDGLGGLYPCPTFVKAVATQSEAVTHILSNPEHHAIAPNGDLICFDGEAVVREPGETC